MGEVVTLGDGVAGSCEEVAVDGAGVVEEVGGAVAGAL